MSISPLSLTDHAQCAPLAVLSMQMPTAVRPSMADAGLDSKARAISIPAYAATAATGRGVR
jgi:hypothetical protein